MSRWLRVGAGRHGLLHQHRQLLGRRGVVPLLATMVLCLSVIQTMTLLGWRSPTFFEVHISVVDDCSEFWDYMSSLNSSFWDTKFAVNQIRPVPGVAQGTRVRRTDTIDSQALCPDIPDGLIGEMNVSFDDVSWSDLEELIPNVVGGHWSPTTCRPRHRIAIVIPYRDRDHHLRILLRHLHPLLQRQMLDYTIYVSEQDHSSSFNRGMIKNIGALHAMEMQDFDCVFFHDVDLIPQHDHNLYYCHNQPYHLSIRINDNSRDHAYKYHFGGVVTINRDQLVAVNGYSNAYFKWGSEDDDLSKRIRARGLDIEQNTAEVGMYQMVPHVSNSHDGSGRWRKVRWGHCRFEFDGLNTLRYSVLETEKRKLFTRIYVSINETEVMQNIPVPPPQTTADPNLSTLEKYKYFGKPETNSGIKPKDGAKVLKSVQLPAENSEMENSVENQEQNDHVKTLKGLSYKRTSRLKYHRKYLR